MTRNEVFLTVVDMLQSGISVELVGEHGSGRTHLLRRVREHFRTLGWRTIEVTGNHALKEVPLAALSVSGLPDAADGRRTLFSFAYATVRDQVVANQTVLVIDDSDALDQLTWGVLSAISSQLNVPFIASRLSQRPPHVQMHPSSGFTSVHAIEVPPMDFSELKFNLEQTRGMSFDPLTMSRIYAKSGGNIGLAEAIVDAAVRAKSIREDASGRLHAQGSLWTPALRSITDVILQPLDAPEVAAMKSLSLLGPVDLDTALRVVPEALLVKLEELGFISVTQSGVRRLVSVKIPLIIEHFRNVSTAAQRAAILGRIDSAVQTQLEPVAADERPRSQAVDVQLIHETARVRTIRAREALAATPSLAHAIDLLHALEADTVLDSDEVEALLDTVGTLEGTDAQRADWAAAYAFHLAHHHGQAHDAIAALHRTATSLPGERATLLASALLLQLSIGECPENDPLAEFRLQTLSKASRHSVIVARAYWLLVRGQVGAADDLILEHGGTDDDDPRLDSIIVYCQIALGNLDLASKIAEKRLVRARAEFDGPRIRAYAFLSAFTALIARRADEAERIIVEASALGLPAGESPLSHVGLTVMSAYFAVKRGQRSLVDTYLEDLDTLGLADGPLPGLQRTTIHARLAMLDGDPEQAWKLAREGGDELWAKGARLASAYMYVDGLLMNPSNEAWDSCSARLAEVQIPGLEPSTRFVRSLALGDADEALSVVEQVRQHNHLESVHLARRAISSLERSEAPPLDVISTLRKIAEDTENFHLLPMTLPELTPREREVAGLIASGMSNPMIAEALVLSVRTVESHINKLMKKLGARRREDVREFLIGTSS